MTTLEKLFVALEDVTNDEESEFYRSGMVADLRLRCKDKLFPNWQND